MNPSLLDDEIQNGLLSIGLSKTINEYQELDQRYQWNLISWKYCQKLDKLNLFPINSWYFFAKKNSASNLVEPLDVSRAPWFSRDWKAVLTSENQWKV